MVTSAVDICNLALSRIGQPPITDLLDGTPTADVCNTNYDPCRKATLRAFPWTFAKQRKALAKLDTDPVWGFDNHFQLPAEFLWMIDVDTTLAWKIEGKRLLTNADAPLNILYIFDAEDPVEFSPEFIDALADRIAAEVVFAITKNMKYREAFLSTFAAKIDEAHGVDSQQGTPDEIESNALIDVRN